MFYCPYFILLSDLMKLITLIIILVGMILGIEISKFSVSYRNLSIKYLNLSGFFSSI